jgi:hypothetical protein
VKILTAKARKFSEKPEVMLLFEPSMHSTDSLRDFEVHGMKATNSE